MNDKETDYLNTLFASSSDITDELETEVPLVDLPENLGSRLYAITESAPTATTSARPAIVKQGFFENWPKVTSIAACLLLAFVGLQFYQQQQTLKQLEQAQSDLATALHYLGEANRIAQAQVSNSLNETINKAGVAPVREIGRGIVKPNYRQRAPKTRNPNRSL